MTTDESPADPQLARWQRFRKNRNEPLASDYGWLTLTSFQWLETRRPPSNSPPGCGPRTARRRSLSAAAADGLTLVGTGETVDGTVSAKLANEESLMWVQFGGADGRQVVVELAMRANKYRSAPGIRRRRCFTGFDGVPTFDYRPDLVIEARFLPYPEPVDVPIGTANPLCGRCAPLRRRARLPTPGQEQECRLQAEERKLGALTVTFTHETNWLAHDEWRKVSTARPRVDSRETRR